MLSKTDFLLYLEAPMHLWAKSHGQLNDEPLSPYTQFMIEQGQQVESLAKEYLQSLVLKQNPQAQLTWQRTFSDDKFLARTDALIYDPAVDAYDLYEIKSSTSVKKDHEFDLAFQALLLKSQINLRWVYLVHINKEYQQHDFFEPLEFFTIEDLTEKVADRYEESALARDTAYRVTQMPSPLPEFACTKPKSCPCPALCHPVLPENSIYNLPYIGKKALTLREMGVTAIEDIPDDFDLNIKQQKHLQSVQTGQPVIDADAIRQALGNLEYPLYFLDYETFNPAVPLFPGYRPYEHIVFQYSLHELAQIGADPQHYEYLITDRNDPAPRLVQHLLSNLKSRGSVVVWNQSFEAGRNISLAEHCPAYREQLLEINARLFDLMLIFRDGHYVHPAFHGSASLKAVLPVLCPELTYEDMAISVGEEAMLTYYRFQTGEIQAENQTKVEADMKAYCKLDTYGMVAILNKLRSESEF